MSKAIITESLLRGIADAIREKTGNDALLTPSEMSTEIESISGGSTPTGTKQISITQNGTTTEDVTNYANAEITVNVPSGYEDNAFANGTAPSGNLTISTDIAVQIFYRRKRLSKVTQTSGGANARAFQEATGLQYFIGKNTSFFYAQVFKGCTNLEAVDVGASYSWKFETENFAQCSKLATLVLRKSAVISIANVNVLLSTPFASNGTGGILYVPQSVISDYQANSVWSTILGYANNQILPIEGSIYETQYADGTVI